MSQKYNKRIQLSKNNKTSLLEMRNRLMEIKVSSFGVVVTTGEAIPHYPPSPSGHTSPSP